MRILTPVAVVCFILGTLTAAAADETPRLGRPIEDFTLRDFRGAERRLDDWSDQKLVVVAFLGVDCPLAKLYAPRLEELAQEFADRGVQFVGIDSNRQDSVTEMLHFAQARRLSFPFLKDAGNMIADAFGAVRTPEVFILDEDRVVRYWGRIDDQYGFEDGIGFQRQAPRRRDLAEALEELLAEKPVSVPETEARGCHIGRIRPVNEDSEVTWSQQIVRIFQEHCQECHRPGQIAPFPLLSYDDVLGWGEMIREVVEENRMPPWHANPAYGEFVNDPRMTDEQKELIYEWVKNGCPEGDLAELPPPREFIDGWQIPDPDQVVYMSEEPFVVAPDGVIEYQWFEVDPGFKEDKWIKAVECRPGNPAVVHHVTVYFKPPWADWTLKLGERINMLGGFSPGKRPVNDPGWKGMARFVPAGSKFMFEMHYTPNGTEQLDRSSIALVFAKPEEVKKQLSVVAAANNTFEIPPHAPNHRVECWYEVDEDSLLYAMSPHMHLRGKSFTFVAHYPDGGKEILLDVPRFDFNWQTDYMLVEPKELPRGTRIQSVAHFDNSADNVLNPDPDATVRWGDQTWEEMMIGAIAIAPADQDIARGIGTPVRVHASYRLLTALIVAAGIGGLGTLGLAWFTWRRLGRRAAGSAAT